ncbi:HD domain-containing phosphohydrolase [Vibrio diazotrophicus]|uniref:HD domain-containing phosphohydrolase n=1 Tax=Vibrio diazotrophicus TaxID=685 RepID=UPI00142D2C77|nr:HD domain-containing phosphohydrolase [Vibrio diazotrophicus]NIY92917.1 response regulator [Vibrio diazotrophicus]
MTLFTKQLPRILVVDDEPANLKVIRQVLQEDYRLTFARSGQEALARLEQESVDLILLDVMMPEMTGFELCKLLKDKTSTASIPVIFVTALRDSIDEEKGFALGGVDYIVKPIIPAIVRARVKTHLSLVKIEVLRETQIDLIQRLGRAAEYKDNETGMHVQRMSHYTKMLAMAAGMAEEQAEELRMATTMHDIGKIGIPDNILLKPGKLDEQEFVEMKKHVQIGGNILSNPRSTLISLAHAVATSHHEKWDGSGYPNGLSGEAIPVEGRMAAIADVFDALTSERPYKKAWSIEDAFEFLKSQSGKHFDPQLVEIFVEQIPAILEVKGKFNDHEIPDPFTY